MIIWWGWRFRWTTDIHASKWAPRVGMQINKMQSSCGTFCIDRLVIRCTLCWYESLIHYLWGPPRCMHGDTRGEKDVCELDLARNQPHQIILAVALRLSSSLVQPNEKYRTNVSILGDCQFMGNSGVWLLVSECEGVGLVIGGNYTGTSICTYTYVHSGQLLELFMIFFIV